MPELNIMTISKADSWIYDRIPRFVAMLKRHNPGARRHILVTEDGTDPAELRYMREQLEQHFHQVVVVNYRDPYPGMRLLYFDKLRSVLLDTFGISEGLYADPDTDIVESMSELVDMAPNAQLLWPANPVPVATCLADLAACEFNTNGILMESGFMYMRKDFVEEFSAFQDKYPGVHPFMPGPTYWNMVMLSIGDRAFRLPDEYNRTFWDIHGCVKSAKSIHYTGQWKLLQPHLVYYRTNRNHIVIEHTPVVFPECEIKPYARTTVQ